MSNANPVAFLPWGITRVAHRAPCVVERCRVARNVVDGSKHRTNHASIYAQRRAIGGGRRLGTHVHDQVRNFPRGGESPEKRAWPRRLKESILEVFERFAL